jgi:putative transposase
MMVLLQVCKKKFKVCARFIQDKFIALTIPSNQLTLATGTISDLPRSKSQLLAQNALLRQQLIILSRQTPKPKFTPFDRFLLVILFSKIWSWKNALFIVKPATLLKWHRQGFRLLWKLKSKPKKREPKISQETIQLIQQMAKENHLWGAERIRGELLKLQIRVSKRTILKYMSKTRPSCSPSQNWRTFLRNHANNVWACDFLPVVDLFFGQIYAFFIIEHGSRRVVHFGVTRHPTQEWGAQQLTEATPFGEQPQYLIRDNNAKFGHLFDKVAADSGIKILKTPIRAPKANSLCERFQGSVRRELLDHFFILNERHLYRILKEYIHYFNHQRPDQGIKQALPVPLAEPTLNKGKIVPFPILGGLHHSYKRVA